MSRHVRRTIAPAAQIRRCESADVERITAREPAGRGYAVATYERQRLGKCEYLVAWVDDVPVGSGELDWSPVPELKNLKVEADHRNQGIGRLLIAAAESEARSRGQSRLCMGVDADNLDARRLYERLGYRGTDRVSTVEYEYVDDEGRTRHACETNEDLEKVLRPTT